MTIHKQFERRILNKSSEGVHYLYAVYCFGVVCYFGVSKQPFYRFTEHRRAKTVFGGVVRSQDQDIEFRVVIAGERDYIFELEKRAIKEFNTRVPFGYNRAEGGIGNRNPLQSTRDRISQSRQGRKHSEEVRIKMSKSQRGRKHSIDTIQKISASRIGNKYCVGRVLSPIHRSKLILANLGKSPSLETRKKISELLKKRNQEIKEL